MTIHSSLRGASTLSGERSVLSRKERIIKLTKDGKFDPASSPAWGLPKVRTHFKVITAKKIKAAAAAEATDGKEKASEKGKK